MKLNKLGGLGSLVAYASVFASFSGDAGALMNYLKARNPGMNDQLQVPVQNPVPLAQNENKIVTEPKPTSQEVADGQVKEEQITPSKRTKFRKLKTPLETAINEEEPIAGPAKTAKPQSVSKSSKQKAVGVPAREEGQSGSNTTVSGLAMELRKARHERDKYKEEADSLNQTVAEYVAALEKRNERVKALKGNNKELTKQLDEAQQEALRLKQEIEESQKLQDQFIGLLSQGLDKLEIDTENCGDDAFELLQALIEQAVDLKQAVGNLTREEIEEPISEPKVESHAVLSKDLIKSSSDEDEQDNLKEPKQARVKKEILDSNSEEEEDALLDNKVFKATSKIHEKFEEEEDQGEIKEPITNDQVITEEEEEQKDETISFDQKREITSELIEQSGAPSGSPTAISNGAGPSSNE